MKTNKAIVYSLCLCVGAALALYVVPHGARSHAHAPQYAPDFVARGDSPIGVELATFARRLEEGSAGLQDVVDTTHLLLATLSLKMQAFEDGARLPLIEDGQPFGFLRIPNTDAEDGKRKWVFEVSIPALPRYEGIADYADIEIAYGCAQDGINEVTAYTQTSLHRRADTLAAIGSQPYRIGGWLGISAESSRWSPLTMTVEAASPENPVWTSAVGQPVQGEDDLTTADVSSVAAILFSL